MGDEEELLGPPRLPLPRRVRLGALLLAVLAVGTAVAVRVWPRSDHPSAAPPPASETTTATPRPWPTAPGACGSDADLPIVSSTAPGERTGIRVLLAGSRLRTVDFDTGRVTGETPAGLRPGEFVVDLDVASQTYAVTTTCEFSSLRVVRVGVGTGPVALAGSIDMVLSDGVDAWGVASPTEHHPHGFLIPLAGGRRVQLPAGFYPQASVSGIIVGFLQRESEGTEPGSVLLVDAATGTVRANLGKGWPVAAGNGFVVWAEACDAVSNEPCTLRRVPVDGGPVTSYRLPRPAFTGLVSPDRRLIVLTLERPTQDAQFEGHPIAPNDIAILNVDTGRLTIVPGIEVPAKASPGLAFSADSRWLVIALDAGSKTRLLAWRPGLARPYESTPVAGQTLQPPPIVVVPARTDR